MPWINISYKKFDVIIIKLLSPSIYWSFVTWCKEYVDEFNHYVEDFIKTEDDRLSDNYFKNKLLDESLTIEEAKALKELDLKMPISLEKIKKNYKKLVKIFHPDVNGNNKDAEEKFKQINESYKLLLKKFMKKND